MANTESTLTEIQTILGEVEEFAPIAAAGASLIPGASPWIGVGMALLSAVGNAVTVVQSAQGLSTADAITAVLQHLTPGQPNAPALSSTAVTPGPANPTG